VAYWLHPCGLPVVMTEIAQPLPVRRGVVFGQEIRAAKVRVQRIAAWRVHGVTSASAALEHGLCNPRENTGFALQHQGQSRKSCFAGV